MPGITNKANNMPFKLLQAKSPMFLIDIFSSRKKVRSRFLNILGVQPCRVLLAGIISKFLIKKSIYSVKIHTQSILQNGVTVIPDYLDEEEFFQLQGECLTYLNDDEVYIETKFGETIQRVVWCDLDRISASVYLKKFIHESGVIDLFRSVEGNWVNFNDISVSLEYLVNGCNSDPDENKEWHVDTFYSTHKAWLYLCDVNINTCPYTFVLGSHKFSFTRLLYEYIWSNRPSESHSWRLDPKDQRKLLSAIFYATGKQNSLAISNTWGIHKRGDGDKGTKRILLRMGVRRQPFFIKKLNHETENALSKGG